MNLPVEKATYRPPPNNNNSSDNLAYGLSAGAVFIVLVCCSACCRYACTKRKRNKVAVVYSEQVIYANYDPQEYNREPTQYSYDRGHRQIEQSNYNYTQPIGFKHNQDVPAYNNNQQPHYEYNGPPANYPYFSNYQNFRNPLSNTNNYVDTTGGDNRPYQPPQYPGQQITSQSSAYQENRY